MTTTMRAVPQIIDAAKQADDGMEGTLIYDKVCTQLGFRPDSVMSLQQMLNRSSSSSKRDRHRAGKLTQRVWDSLNPDGSVDPVKAVPFSVVTTQELPTIGGADGS